MFYSTVTVEWKLLEYKNGNKLAICHKPNVLHKNQSENAPRSKKSQRQKAFVI